jgi:hypothetical protein
MSVEEDVNSGTIPGTASWLAIERNGACARHDKVNSDPLRSTHPCGLGRCTRRLTR